METWNLLVNSAIGVYIPQFFAKSADGGQINDDDREILLSGPDNEDYWETWEDVLNYCELTDTYGNKFTLHHDCDLWAVPVGFDWDTLEGC